MNPPRKPVIQERKAKRKSRCIPDEEVEPQRNFKKPMLPHEFGESTCNGEYTQVGKSSRKQASPQSASSGMTYSREQCGAPSSFTAASEAELRGGQSCSTPSYSSGVPSGASVDEIIALKRVKWPARIKYANTIAELELMLTASVNCEHKCDKNICLFRCQTPAREFPTKRDLRQHLSTCIKVKKRRDELDARVDNAPMSPEQTSKTPRRLDQEDMASPSTSRSRIASPPPLTGVSGC